jgi:LysM repeat protein
MAFGVSACFQSAGSAVEPTIANATATNPLPQPVFPTQPPPGTPLGVTNLPPAATFTPFMTPIGPEGFQTPIPTLDVIPPTVAPTEPPPVQLSPTTEPTQAIAPTADPGVQPTAAPLATTPAVPPTAGNTTSLATPTPLPTDPPCEYTVERNDTFYAIARKLKIEPQALIEANPRTNPNALQIGEKLQIPNCKAGTPAALTTAAATAATTTNGTPAAGTTALPAGIQAVYIIQSGDTLGKIAQRYGVTVQEIVRANGFANENVILNVNQKILIPARTQ